VSNLIERFKRGMIGERILWVPFYQKVSAILEILRPTNRIIPGRNRVSQKSSREKIPPKPLESFADFKIRKCDLVSKPLLLEAGAPFFSMRTLAHRSWWRSMAQ